MRCLLAAQARAGCRPRAPGRPGRGAEGIMRVPAAISLALCTRPAYGGRSTVFRERVQLQQLLLSCSFCLPLRFSNFSRFCCRSRLLLWPTYASFKTPVCALHASSGGLAAANPLLGAGPAHGSGGFSPLVHRCCLDCCHRSPAAKARRRKLQAGGIGGPGSQAGGRCAQLDMFNDK